VSGSGRKLGFFLAGLYAIGWTLALGMTSAGISSAVRESYSLLCLCCSIPYCASNCCDGSNLALFECSLFPVVTIVTSKDDRCMVDWSNRIAVFPVVVLLFYDSGLFHSVFTDSPAVLISALSYAVLMAFLVYSGWSSCRSFLRAASRI
jgi:hypothetical protein